MSANNKKPAPAQPPQPMVLKRGATALVKNRGTGFEEFFADPPMTPVEATEEREEIYHPDRLFVHRIEECIQRFRSRRRLTGDQIKFFDMYLFLGGVDTSQRQFNGMDMAELRGLTPAERREATATDTVHTAGNTLERFYNHNNPAHWEVDLTGVAAGFFSEVVPVLAGGREGEAIAVVEHFLRYVAQHDVCPEHADDVKRALALCNTARVELPLLSRCILEMPGQFHLAATQLFCPDDENVVYSPPEKFPDGFDAKVFFDTAVCLAGTDKQVQSWKETPDIHIVAEYQRDLELVQVTHPDDKLVHIFKGLRLQPPNGPKGLMAPIGTAIFKPCVVEDGWYRPAQPDPASLPNVTLLLEDPLLRLVKPGLKFRLGLCELNIGVVFIRKFEGIFPTFHTFLPQHLMKSYKEPVDNPRPAASVLDRDAEERQMASECKV